MTYIEETIKEYRAKFKHSQFIVHGAIEEFWIEKLKEAEDRGRQIGKNEIKSSDQPKTKQMGNRTFEQTLDLVKKVEKKLSSMKK